MDNALSSRPPYRIQPALGKHALEIAGLHQRYISGSPADFWKETWLLEAYYREIVNGQDGFVYVALLNERVIGYASVVRQQFSLLLRALMKSRVLWKVLSMKPGQWWRLCSMAYAKVSHELLSGKWRGITTAMLPNAYELRSIAVEKDFAAQRVGTELLHAVLKQADRENMLPIIAWVIEKNMASRHLFEGMGFNRKAMRTDNAENVIVYVYGDRQR